MELQQANKSFYDDEETELLPGSDVDTASEVKDSVRTYLNDIHKIPLLSAEEEVELAKQIEAGVYAARLLENTDAQSSQEFTKGFKKREFLTDEEEADLHLIVEQGRIALNDFWQANLRLSVARAKRRGYSGLDLLDRIQEGNLGLLRAIQKFDYTQGFKFSTYAIAWLDQRIDRGIKDKGGNIRLPQYFGEDVDRIKRARRELLQKLGREATNQEVAAEIEMDTDKIMSVMHTARITNTRSLDVIVGDGESRTLLDTVAQTMLDDPEDTAKENAEYYAAELMQALSEREKDIISAYYGLGIYKDMPQTSQVIAKRYGVSRERISKIERDAKKKMADRAIYLQRYGS